MSPSSASADVCNAQMPNMMMWTSFFSASYAVNATLSFIMSKQQQHHAHLKQCHKDIWNYITCIIRRIDGKQVKAEIP